MIFVELKPLEALDTEQFILDNQEAFNYGALEEFGKRDDHYEEDEQIISRNTIVQSINEGETYRIMFNGQAVDGVIVKVENDHGHLEILFVSPRVHSKGIGYAAWLAIEKKMKIFAMTFRLHAPWVNSLKEKRMIVKSLIARLQNKFHVSAAEVDEQDTHHIIVIGVAAIVPHNSMADSIMDEISGFVENNTEAEILDETREIR